MYNLLVIAGPTASGKSSLALKIAKKYGGEIISADSWTVYPGFNIGTAKPTPDERQAVAHHLIDVAKPDDGFNAALFKELAVLAINDINSRNKLAILVGGTGLYIDSVLYDYEFLPTPSLAIRQKHNALTLTELHELAIAQSINLEYIDIRNKRRVIRAIETKGAIPKKQHLRSHTLVVGLDVPLDQLKQNIILRINRMFELGLEKEVSILSKQYKWDIEAMKGIGYREFRLYFEGQESLEQVKTAIIASTFNLVKRQRTWLKRNKDIHWYSNIDAAYDGIVQQLNT